MYKYIIINFIYIKYIQNNIYKNYLKIYLEL